MKITRFVCNVCSAEFSPESDTIKGIKVFEKDCIQNIFIERDITKCDRHICDWCIMSIRNSKDSN